MEQLIMEMVKCMHDNKISSTEEFIEAMMKGDLENNAFTRGFVEFNKFIDGLVEEGMSEKEALSFAEKNFDYKSIADEMKEEGM